MIPLSAPNISGNEWKYVKECLDTEWVSTAGKYVDLFEKKIAEYTGSKYAVACVNGTSALQVSLRLAGVNDGDEVIVPTVTFIAPVNAVSYNGASPIFMDVDKYYNLDVEKVIEFILNETKYKDGATYNKKTNRLISAILPVHMWGNAVWLDELFQICEERNIVIVEDACESLGTFYNNGIFNGQHTGTVGKLGSLSFNGNKIITAGGGGMILTDDEKLAEKARYLTTQAKDDPIRYVHNEIGYNYRLTNIQAAMGVAQLERLPEYLTRKREIFNKYQIATDNVDGLNIADVPAYAENNNWMIILQIDKNIYCDDREGLMKRLDENEIQSRPVWKSNHKQTPYSDCEIFRIERAEELVEKSLCLPSSFNLSENQIRKVIKQLHNG